MSDLENLDFNFMGKTYFACVCVLFSSQTLWSEGPEDPVQFAKGVSRRKIALLKWQRLVHSDELLRNSINLTEIFHPAVLLNAIRQRTARLRMCELRVVPLIVYLY